MVYIPLLLPLALFSFLIRHIFFYILQSGFLTHTFFSQLIPFRLINSDMYREKMSIEKGSTKMWRKIACYYWNDNGLWISFVFGICVCTYLAILQVKHMRALSKIFKLPSTTTISPPANYHNSKIIHRASSESIKR